jgi:hypothetical protein
MKKKHIYLILGFISTILFVVLAWVLVSTFPIINRASPDVQGPSTINFDKLLSLYNYGYREYQEIDYDILFKNYEIIEEDLLDYLNTKESLGVDIHYFLPFVNVEYTHEKRIKKYNWYKFTGGNLIEGTTIIQYVPLSGTPNAVLFSRENSYNHVYSLYNDIYLLVVANRSGGTVYINYCTITIDDNIPVLYNGFNGESNFGEIIQYRWDEDLDIDEYIPRRGLPGTIYFQSNGRSYVFDGEHYIGDYSNWLDY